MSNQKTSVISLFFWGVAIAISLTLIFQNLQPLVTLYFLGKSTLPVPLSLAILAAFLIGGLGAFVINLISFWLSPNKLADRSEAEFEDEFDEPEYPKTSPPPRQSKPAPPKDNTVPYGANYEDEDDDDVIDIKYTDR